MISAEEFLRGRGVNPRVCDPAATLMDAAATGEESAAARDCDDRPGIERVNPEKTYSEGAYSEEADFKEADSKEPGAGESGAGESGAVESSAKEADGEGSDSEASAAQPSRSLLRLRGSFGGSATREWARPSAGSSRGWHQGHGGHTRRRRSAGSWQGAENRMTGGHDTDGAPRALGKSEDRAHDLDKCQEAALRLLDASARSVRDMQERLLGKGYDPSVVERVVGNLIRVGLLDDQAYARGLVEHCLGRLLGARGAERELLRKGVPRRIAHDAVQDAEDAGRFAVAADELAQKTARRTQGLDRETRLRRFWSAGGRKGHSPQDLRAAADRYLIDES